MTPMAALVLILGIIDKLLELRVLRERNLPAEVAAEAAVERWERDEERFDFWFGLVKFFRSKLDAEAKP